MLDWYDKIYMDPEYMLVGDLMDDETDDCVYADGSCGAWMIRMLRKMFGGC